jgi:DNA (cytosine-5)-methyltransferase 1
MQYAELRWAYEPDYFLLENVAGLLDHRLQDRQTTNAGVAEDLEIQSGMVKFILRTAIALGYDAIS